MAQAGAIDTRVGFGVKIKVIIASSAGCRIRAVCASVRTSHTLLAN